ncbi:MAG: ribosome maturation factor RimM [Acidobacteria bacterium]|nr:ribosome maturation factor RimM [Acidobacteriota bacterium]MCU0253946.1 ribosome maturation factor RimM [Acidobacteriota bacterium]
MTDSRPVILARIRRPWGLRGELLLELHSDWPEERFAPGAELELAWDDGRSARATVRAFRRTGTGPLLSLEGADGIGDARAFTGAAIVADAGALPRLADDGDWQHADLVGLTVVLPDGSRVGRVEAVEEGAAADLAVVRLDGGGEALIPLVPAIAVAIDRGRGALVVDPPAGLLDPEAAAPAPSPARSARRPA